MTPITQMGNIAFRSKNANNFCVGCQRLPALKSASVADLGIIQDDGKVIRLVFPALTEERRKEIVKQVWKIAEDAKISLRNARKDCLNMLKQLKKDIEISEDEMSSLEKEVQKITDQFNGQIETLAQAKQKEVLEILI